MNEEAKVENLYIVKVMIPAQLGWVAQFLPENAPADIVLPVVAWVHCKRKPDIAGYYTPRGTAVYGLVPDKDRGLVLVPQFAEWHNARFVRYLDKGGRR